MVAADVLELDQEGVPRRLDSRVILLAGFQPGARPVVFLANRRKLAGGLKPLFRPARLGNSGLGPFRLTVKPVEEIGFRIRVPGLCGQSLDLLHEELVLTLLALDVLTGIKAAHAQRSRTIGADHVNQLGRGTRIVQGTCLEFRCAWCHQMVGHEDTKPVFAMLALHVATAEGERDSQVDQAFRTSRHKVRGHLAHGHFPRARKSRELTQRVGTPS